MFIPVNESNIEMKINSQLAHIMNYINGYNHTYEGKKLYGEVFTPIGLVNDMLDKLPPEVWGNPNLKWLDPANGIGNFPIVIVKRLMKGLKDWEVDDWLRLKHILENQIYVCEL